MIVDLDYWSYEWEKQQNSLIEKREERFDTLFDITEEINGKMINALDLGCGPGSLEKRFLARFPDSHITSIDYDPVTLEVARSTIISSRAKFIERDLRTDDWDTTLNHETYDVIYSTTALHWLPEADLCNVYKKAFQLLKRKGSLINGDHMRSENRSEKLEKIYEGLKENILERNKSQEDSMRWEEWWNEFRTTGWRPDLFEERERRLETGNHDRKVSMEKHVQFLKDSGFSLVDIPWKYLDNFVLLAIK
jgi:SAM-dependent methyltransferase